ncbi:synaptotagmin-like protein 1 isoform X3 [Vombatus ursinus]|uniref:synaptotagmin-like protein 1 isoform X3 n=1 Tax=Vombatus ursinus TaxID=29139 RepID=UPI000FFD1F22|nr:synaptotagmin-like protein 1 isoform X3 [Vombatus ursinus]
MAYEVEGDALLDLSFLTEEEQEAITSVLSRDARLRQLEEGRVSKLRASLVDPGQLKTLTGDWFRDARSQRHRHARLGSDLVRASIRRKKRSRGEPELGSEGEPEEEEVGSSLRLSLEVPTPERGSEAQPSSSLSLQAPAPAPTEEKPGSQAQAGTDPSSGVEGWEKEEVVVEEEKQEKKKEEEEARARKVQEPEPEPEPELGPELELEGKGKRNGKKEEEPNSPLVQSEPGLQSLENGEEEPLGSPGRGSAPPINRMLSSSSSVSSLSSSTLREKLPPPRQVPAKQAQDRGEETQPEPGVQRDPAVLGGAVGAWWPRAPPFRVAPREPWPKPLLGRGRGALGHVGLGFPVGLAAPAAPGEGLPPSGELHFWVKDAQNLIPFRSGPLDCYIQCSVLPDDSRTSRQRTRVVRRSLSPVFNHTMVYDGFESADLQQACAELSLWDYGTLGSRLLGGTRLSLGTGSSYGLQVPWMDSTPEEKHLWQTLLARPCEWVDGLLPLRTNLVPRT